MECVAPRSEPVLSLKYVAGIVQNKEQNGGINTIYSVRVPPRQLIFNTSQKEIRPVYTRSAVGGKYVYTPIYIPSRFAAL
jgi:hypothetical protein